MKLSLRAIEICKQKCGKSALIGFDNLETSLIDEISEKDAVSDFNELLKAGLVMLSGEEVQMSPLGWHIVKMLHKPEQYIEITNTINKICVRFYHKNTYYLCSIEDLSIAAVDNYDRFHLELLPDLNLVVGAFSYALYPENDTLTAIDYQDESDSVIIKAKAWDEVGKLSSIIELTGQYEEEGISFKSLDDSNSIVEDIKTATISSVINKMTDWLLKCISENLREEDYVKI